MYAKQFGWTAKKYNCKLIVARSNEHTAMTTTAAACAISEFVLATTDKHTVQALYFHCFALFAADSGRTYVEYIRCKQKIISSANTQ